MGAATVFYVIGVGLSLTLNLLVTAVYLYKRSRINHFELIIVSLAVSDILQAGTGYPLEIHSKMTDLKLEDASCTLAGFAVTFFGLVSISHLVGISIERLIILRYPWKAREWVNDKWISLYIIIPSWAYGFIWALMPLVGWSSYVPENNDKHRCSINLRNNDFNTQSYAYSLLVSCFVLPIMIIGICSAFIHNEIKKMSHQALPLGMSETLAYERRKIERRNSVMVFIIIATFFIAWSPYAACVFAQSTNNVVPPKLLNFSAIFAKTSTLYNPIIYSMYSEDFRSSLRALLRIPQSRVGPMPTGTTNTTIATSTTSTTSDTSVPARSHINYND